jgi:PAS domain S-box-containing protein
MKDKALLDAVIENAIDGIITISERGIIESINPAACKLFRYSPEEVLGKNVSMLMPSPDRERHDSYLDNYITTGHQKIIGIGRDVMGRRKDGSIFPLRLGVSEVISEDKRIFAGFIHDLSYQKEVEHRLLQYTTHLEDVVKDRTKSLNETIAALMEAKEEVSQSLEKEKELGKLKSRLLSMASHEFRTPLSTIQLSASLVDKYSQALGAANINKHIAKIKNAVNNLTNILNDFLQLEKAESGKVEVSLSNFDIARLISETVEEMQMIAKAGQQISFEHSSDESVVHLDKNLVRNCIINLLSNSIKYSAENTSVKITLNTEREKCIITVKDEGIGIPEEDKKYLFDAFFRASNTENIPGTGLGLNIVLRYVKMMNGNIDFESSPKGTIFTITFPMT